MTDFLIMLDLHNGVIEEQQNYSLDANLFSENDLPRNITYNENNEQLLMNNDDDENQPLDITIQK